MKMEIKIHNLTIQDAIELDLPAKIKNVVLKDVIDAVLKDAAKGKIVAARWEHSTWDHSVQE